MLLSLYSHCWGYECNFLFLHYLFFQPNEGNSVSLIYCSLKNLITFLVNYDCISYYNFYAPFPGQVRLTSPVQIPWITVVFLEYMYSAFMKNVLVCWRQLSQMWGPGFAIKVHFSIVWSTMCPRIMKKEIIPEPSKT